MMLARKPGYARLWEACPEPLQATFVQVFEAVEPLVPDYLEPRRRERTLSLIMASWIMMVSDAEKLPIPRYVYGRAALMAKAINHVIGRDERQGGLIEQCARQVLAALEADGLIPPPS